MNPNREDGQSRRALRAWRRGEIAEGVREVRINAVF